MSVQTARVKLADFLLIQGLPQIKQAMGVPTNWQDAAHPGFYLGFGVERFQHDFLIASDVTSGFCDLAAVFTVQGNQSIQPIPDGMSILEYIYLLGDRIHQSIMELMRSRENENDGDRGFLAEVLAIEYDFAPDKAVGLGKVTIRISQYS